MTLQQAQELLRPSNHGGLLELIGQWHGNLSWNEDNFENTEHLIRAYEVYRGEAISSPLREIIINECQSHFFMIWQ